jgi:hypothetical protein
MTPDKLNFVYSIDDNTGSINATQMVYSTHGHYYSASDLNIFQNKYHLPLQDVSINIGGHNYSTSSTGTSTGTSSGGNVCGASVSTCVQASADLEYLMAVSQLSPTTYWYSDNWLPEWILEVANYTDSSTNNHVGGTGSTDTNTNTNTGTNKKAPKVIVINYAGPEPHADLMAVFNYEALKLGLLGVTIVAGSGVNGAVAPAMYRCTYSPLFPASSPYVTTVGATQVRYYDLISSS